jgi:hypothetical protein
LHVLKQSLKNRRGGGKSERGVCCAHV